MMVTGSTLYNQWRHVSYCSISSGYWPCPLVSVRWSDLLKFYFCCYMSPRSFPSHPKPKNSSELRLGSELTLIDMSSHQIHVLVQLSIKYMRLYKLFERYIKSIHTEYQYFHLPWQTVMTLVSHDFNQVKLVFKVFCCFCSCHFDHFHLIVIPTPELQNWDLVQS